MAVLPLVIAPDPRLKVICRKVAAVDGAIRQLMDDMVDTMHARDGIGLAAPQVGRDERVIVADIAGRDEPANPIRMANPEIVWVSDDERIHEEGCLSLPEHYADVIRPDRVKVRYLDETGKRREIEADGLLSTCLQHEIDHLDGILFVDHISALKRNIILRKLTKTKKLKQAQAA